MAETESVGNALDAQKQEIEGLGASTLPVLSSDATGQTAPVAAATTSIVPAAPGGLASDLSELDGSAFFKQGFQRIWVMILREQERAARRERALQGTLTDAQIDRAIFKSERDTARRDSQNST